MSGIRAPDFSEARWQTLGIRVLLAVPSIRVSFGGPAVTVSGLAHALIEAGVKVGLTTLKTDEDTQWCAQGIRVATVGEGKGVSEIPALVRRFFDGSPPDVIHDNGLWLLFHHSIASCANKMSIPRILSVRGMLTPWALQHHGLRKRIAWLAYQRRDMDSVCVVHATSENEAQEIHEIGLRLPIAVIPNGVEVPPIVPLMDECRSQRTLLFLSRIHPVKGLLLLVKAWSIARPVGWRVVIAGPDEGGHGRTVKAAARKAGVAEDFDFVGPAYGIHRERLYANADLFILPTHSENFGMVVAEALAWGIPVITTRGAPWRILDENRCGWWTEIGAESLAEALRKATALTDEERRAMGFRGRQLVADRYAWSRVAEQMQGVYSWVLGDAPRPACIV